ncbi:Aste57867_18027 [Aphanomyces stellatus]|uniref:Aste57867_18027 protein n=1 Tax=Aphanomyces stellatus TaxID=120398 RepID=A0A485LA84_9STRA|nr:hypothetical protein As57867_017965 [Aphanomyces stellatus]VFT94766.1 Aste57867_18027 [Aphanomyces stellatus]
MDWITTPPQFNKLVTFHGILFPAQDRTPYDVALRATSTHGIPTQITIENGTTRQRWECVVQDTKHHSHNGAHVFPCVVVVAALEAALAAKEKRESAISVVDLHEATRGRMRLVLTLTTFGQLSTVYTFMLTTAVPPPNAPDSLTHSAAALAAHAEALHATAKALEKQFEAVLK